MFEDFVVIFFKYSRLQCPGHFGDRVYYGTTKKLNSFADDNVFVNLVGNVSGIRG